MTLLTRLRQAAGLEGTPPGTAGAALWLARGFVLLWVLSLMPWVKGSVLSWMQFLTGVALAGSLVGLGWRYTRTRILWSLRSKLIVTYLLIGLAPVVLFVTLVSISTYVAAGQFSIHLADTRMHQELESLGEDNRGRADRIGLVLTLRARGMLGSPPGRGRPPGRGPQPGGGRPPLQRPARPEQQVPAAETAAATTEPQNSAESYPNPLMARLHPRTTVYVNGAPPTQGAGVPGILPAGGNPTSGVPLGLPTWAQDLRGRVFRGLVLDGDDLFLVAMDQRKVEPTGKIVTVITSLPVDGPLVDVLAEGLGRVWIAAPVTTRRAAAVWGGTEPGSVTFYDARVLFGSTMDAIEWGTGDRESVPIHVRSRPSLLYRQLFGSSLGSIVTDYIRVGLLVLCVLFATIQALALWSATRLSASITAAVSGLYQATRHVDEGDLAHRIPAVVTSEPDQLGELSRSFNRMTGSLERLLVEQKEKERLQSELSIAQEVQANLFPHHAHNLAELELHGICRPARSVSGDYYDFLVFHHRDPDGNGTGLHARESGVGIVLGDISGKGISAALLMATLHSAVRAYRFASEDMVYSDYSLAGVALTRQGEHPPENTGKLFELPARLLHMLNRHLYRSTQPEKYATLFLAHYEAATATLTYSNAGHLPPVVMSRDGRVRRLDCGGTVVGLLDGVTYDQGQIHMEKGDILVAYSDGVTEPENDFGDFGEQRLLEVVERYRDQPLHVISAQVMLALDAWIGAAEQPDDITLVLARQL